MKPGVIGENQTASAAAGARRRTRLAPILLAIGVTIVAFAWLDHINPGFPISEDGIRDQLLARDCTDLGHCHLIGPRTSLAEFHHGPVWVDLLIAVRLLGGDTSTARTAVLALLALSVGTLCVVIWRWVHASIALPASVLLIGALGLNREPSQLVNDSVSVFPDVLTAAGLLCYGLSGEWRFVMFSAFALGLAINVHVGSLSLAPPLIAMAALGRPRPWRTVLVVAAVLLATCFITSRAALLANMVGLARQGYSVPMLAAVLVIVLVSASLGPRFRRLSWNARAWIIGLILVLPFGVAALWLIFWRHHFFDFRYMHPILGPAVALVAALLWLPFEAGARRLAALRWFPTAAAVVAVTLAAHHVYREPPAPAPSMPWTITEAGVIANRATQRGWVYEDLIFHLQSSACNELLAGMSVWAPPPNPAPGNGRSQLQVIKFRRDAVPTLADSHDLVALEGETVAVLRQIESWLRPEALVACRRPIDSGSAPSCSVAARPGQETRVPEQFLFATRSNPGIHSLDLPAPYIASYEIPLSPGAGETRDLSLTDVATADCGWRITRAEGVNVEGHLPARRVRLRSDNGGPGSVMIEKPFGTTGCPANVVDNRYPPCIIEMQPGDPLGAFVEG